MRYIKAFQSFLIAIAVLFPFFAFANEIETTARNAIVVDLTNDYSVLYEKQADELISPASMSKMMTAYVIFDLLTKGELSMDQIITVPKEAVDRGGIATGSSSMRLNVGQKVSVKDLIHGLLTASGNDAAITLAMTVSGTEAKFAQLMTLKAKELGLQGYFANASGWTDPGQKMSVRDLAILTHRIIADFPQYFPLFSEKEFTFNGVTHQNRNWLVTNRDDVDGMKTGHTEDAGYCITITGVRNGRRMVVVVAGTKSMKERIDEASKLLDWGYANFEWNWFFTKGQTLGEVPIWGGKQASVDLKVQNDVRLFLSHDQAQNLTSFITYLRPVRAPVEENQPLGKVIVKEKNSDEIIASIPLLAANNVEELSRMQRLFFNFKYWRAQGKKEESKG
ncbi:MAG: D-alanyl-D-alanine carboxypeptidase family protein [Alphaproteobacteria bacterium]